MSQNSRARARARAPASLHASLVLCCCRAARAQSSGAFQQEIVPVTTRVVEADGTERTLTVAQDDGIRAGSSLAGLAKLPPAFKAEGSTTAGEWGGGRATRPPLGDAGAPVWQVTPAR